MGVPWREPQRWRVSQGTAALGVWTLLGLGAMWGRLGAGDLATPPDPAAFDVGIACLLGGALLCWLALRAPGEWPSRAVFGGLLFAGAALQPGYLFPLAGWVGMGVAALLVPLIRGRAAWAAVAAVCAIAAWFLVSSWHWGYANIDTFQEVQGASSALLHGQNPYAPTFPVFLDSTSGMLHTGSGHFDYGPAVILLSAPGAALGDVRIVALLLNLSMIVALLRWLRRTPSQSWQQLSLVAAALASPFIPVMTLLEWTDTFSVVPMVWWLVMRDGHRRWAIFCLGVAVASKPTILPVLIPFILWERSVWIELVKATVGAFVVALPFVLWTGLAQFVYDIAGIYADLPARHDSLNLNGLAFLAHATLLPAWVGVVGSVAVVFLFLFRRALRYADLCLLGCGTMVMLSMLAKQAFFNYYYVGAIAALCGLVAVRSQVTIIPPAGIRRLLHIEHRPAQTDGAGASAA